MKYHPHGSVLFITFSIEEGLLLLANPLCEAIIKSCLAKAQSLYPLTISHLLVEATHVHLIAVVDKPDDVHSFMRYFKCESAHMLNGLLGRAKRTVWCEGYDSPIVLSLVRTMLAITYIYSNPAKDNLESCIDNYPGFSTWNMFRKNSYSRTWKGLSRPQFQALSRDSHTLQGYTREANRVLANSKASYSFTIAPNAWLETFGITDPTEQEQYNKKVISHLRVLEKRASERRRTQRKSVLGKERLMNQKLNTTYRPRRTGRMMWCLCEHRQTRVSFINFLKHLWHKAREVRKLWFTGDFSVSYPMGLYPPSMPKLCEPIAAW